ncbi:MAG TPA: nuclear transport factor 2 family protein [Pyrinomonadaceae bacterium]|nr:nuclear transport factor 2 family protein [Pyrinomonadaceae bacterium]
MEQGHSTSVNRSERTVQHDPEKTAVVPRFDQSEVGRARPAVPLGELGATPKRARRRPRPLLVAAIVAGLAGGVLGGVGTAVYQRYQSAPVESVGGSAPAMDDGASASSGDALPKADETLTPVETEEAGASVPVVATDEAAGAGEVEGVENATDEASAGARGDARAQLSAALDGWVAATNARDINRQMSFYDSRLGAFYLARGASREAVRAEKRRVFERASAVDVSAGGPDIRLAPDGRTAVMRFRKRYSIEGAGVGRRGEVVQELRWRRTPQGWKIVSERDLRVID